LFDYNKHSTIIIYIHPGENMTETTLKEAQLFGKLPPTHPAILPVLKEIREKF